MTLHSSPASMLKESLDETLEAVSLCVDYRKTESKWGQFQTNGCLGFPAGVLLFSIIDTIGSYYRKNKAFKIKIDNTWTLINGEGWEHFKVLNSKYFKQNLSSEFIKTLYTKFRSNLTHNSTLGKDTLMVMNEMGMRPITYSSKVFATSEYPTGNKIYIVSIFELYKICKEAVDLFKLDIDSIVPTSKQGHKFH